MKFDFKVVPAQFVERPNRFVVVARLENGELVRAHCADPGRLRELLVPGVKVYVSPARSSVGRRTTHDLRFVEHPKSQTLVSMDTRLPNRLIGSLLDTGDLEPFSEAVGLRSEVYAPVASTKARSRFDFVVDLGSSGTCWIEVKSVTLVNDDVALFPDAPTVRGRRHVEELTHIVRSNLGRAAVIFVVQRPDAISLQPHSTRDPAFAEALLHARTSGVELYAYTCTLTVKQICLARAIPVKLD